LGFCTVAFRYDGVQNGVQYVFGTIRPLDLGDAMVAAALIDRLVHHARW
jgi:hypothetical protein